MKIKTKLKNCRLRSNEDQGQNPPKFSFGQKCCLGHKFCFAKLQIKFINK